MLIKKKEQSEKLEKENINKLKQQMDQLINETKGDREAEKKERLEVQEFISAGEVAKVFKTYDKQLQHMYKFYAAMDSKKENSFDLEYLHSMLDLREFVRFGYH